MSLGQILKLNSCKKKCGHRHRLGVEGANVETYREKSMQAIGRGLPAKVGQGCPL